MTIGDLPPSTVISRYLGAQRMADLARYLQVVTCLLADLLTD